jgi:hypothetical protein
MTMYKIKQFALAPATLILGVGRSCMCPSLQWSRLEEAGLRFSTLPFSKLGLFGGVTR